MRTYVQKRLDEIAAGHLPEIPEDEYARPRMEFARGGPVDADVFSPPELSILKVEALLALPPVGSGARRAGVYFLFRRGQLQYVGQSLNVRSRVGNHDCYRQINFDRATYLAIPAPWHLAVEALYIGHYKPPSNANYVKSGA